MHSRCAYMHVWRKPVLSRKSLTIRVRSRMRACFTCWLRKHDREQQSVQIRWNILHTLLRVCHRKSTPVCGSRMRITCTRIVQRTFVMRDFAPDCEGTRLPGAVKRGLTVLPCRKIDQHHSLVCTHKGTKTRRLRGMQSPSPPDQHVLFGAHVVSGMWRAAQIRSILSRRNRNISYARWSVQAWKSKWGVHHGYTNLALSKAAPYSSSKNSSSDK